MRQEFKRKCGIYALIDPVTDRVMYVGQAEDIEKRFRQHCDGNTFAGNVQKREWVVGLFHQGRKPECKVLEYCESVGDLDSAEKRWIHHYKADGQAELNRSVGGSTRASTKGSNMQREDWFQLVCNLRETLSLLREVATDSLKLTSPKRYDALLKLCRTLDREAQRMAEEINKRFPEWKEISDALLRLK